MKETDGYMTYDTDRTGWRLPNSNEKIKAPNNGDNVYLTIDQKSRRFGRQHDDRSKEYKPKRLWRRLLIRNGQSACDGAKAELQPERARCHELLQRPCLLQL
ncbi:hypothetical protein PO124_05790 [Bacillus licheniformis]|nr:hypothetical protein [Bacillus licheniformis]